MNEDLEIESTSGTPFDEFIPNTTPSSASKRSAFLIAEDTKPTLQNLKLDEPSLSKRARVNFHSIGTTGPSRLVI